MILSFAFAFSLPGCLYHLPPGSVTTQNSCSLTHFDPAVSKEHSQATAHGVGGYDGRRVLKWARWLAVARTP